MPTLNDLIFASLLSKLILQLFWILILVCSHAIAATPKKQWEPPTKPFQNLSTYRNTYKPHQTYRKIPSYKPPNCYSPPKSPFMVRTIPLSTTNTCFYLEMLHLSQVK